MTDAGIRAKDDQSAEELELSRKFLDRPKRMPTCHMLKYLGAVIWGFDWNDFDVDTQNDQASTAPQPHHWSSSRAPTI